MQESQRDEVGSIYPEGGMREGDGMIRRNKILTYTYTYT
jgi:hypothetical protein